MRWNSTLHLALAMAGFTALLMLVACGVNASGSGNQHQSIGQQAGGTTQASRQEGTEASFSQQMSKPGMVPTKVQRGEITSVELDQVFTLINENRILLLDSRPALYYRMGHIEEAVSLPLKKYDTAIESHRKLIEQALADNKIVVLYCQNIKCPDAYAVARKLAALGYSVSIYKGGWEEWRQSGL